MRDLSGTPEEFLSPITNVVEAILAHANQLRSEDVMVVGAWCRDIWHDALGHTFATAATRDLDLALALASWEAYEAVAEAFPSVEGAGIRFRIAGINVELLPLGEIEDPRGSSRTAPTWTPGQFPLTYLPLSTDGRYCPARAVQ